MRDRPDADTLRRVAARDARADPATVAWAHAIADRETAAGAAPVRAWAARLAALTGASAGADPADLERRLVADIRAGRFDDGPGRAALLEHLRASARDRMRETDPDFPATWPILAADPPPEIP